MQLKHAVMLFFASTFAPHGAIAQTPDGVPPSRETACRDADLSGALYGLCVAYGEANDCDEVSSSENRTNCERLAENFSRRSDGQNIQNIFQFASSATIPVDGGSIILNETAEVDFPAGAFNSPTNVTLKTSSSPEIASQFDEFTSIFRPANRLAYEIRIGTGSSPPLSDTVTVHINVPDDFLNAVPTEHQIELFVQILNNGGEETFLAFEIITAEYDSLTGILTALIPSAVFTDYSNTSGEFEAVLTLAPTPGINRNLIAKPRIIRDRQATQSANQSQCQAAAIDCPLARGCEVTSPYNLARKHPVTGATRPHYGVDYRAPNGSVVFAASDGIVERSYTSQSYGETIIIRHTDGSATLYAHLEQRGVNVGDSVNSSQQIGTADNTGTSTGPHLHFEYVPNGQIIQSKGRIDPDACIGALADGSITVRDNGNLADDAFEVRFDGILLGSTTIGAANTLAVSNLLPGAHTVTLTATIAPDNVGTYEISLNDGLVFTSGGTSRSGTLPQGGSVNFAVDVPQ